MTSAVPYRAKTNVKAAPRAEALASRLEANARQLADFAARLSEAEWQQRVPGDGRKVGVLVHHVATMYPLELQLAQTLAAGNPIAGVTMAEVASINAAHAQAQDSVTAEAALELLRVNSAAAAAGIRDFTDEQLDLVRPISLYADAPLSCQFFLEDHPVRHSLHHLARIRAALER